MLVRSPALDESQDPKEAEKSNAAAAAAATEHLREGMKTVTAADVEKAEPYIKKARDWFAKAMAVPVEDDKANKTADGKVSRCCWLHHS